MEMIIIRIGSVEWEKMWEWLGEHPINDGISNPTIAENPINFEKWQYMGSYRGQGGAVVSELRHRSHPMDNERRLIKYLHENGVPESDIAQVIRIK